MAIARVSRHHDSGSWDSEGNYSGEIIYKVICQKDDPATMFSNEDYMKEMGLPIRGDSFENKTVYVASVNFSRAEDRNFKDNGHINSSVPPPYALWDYVVSLSYDYSEAEDRPVTLAISHKNYETFDEYGYSADALNILTPDTTITDTAGTPMASDRQLSNLLLNFTYNTDAFDIEWMTQYKGTSNNRPMNICGFRINKNGARINQINATYSRALRKYSVSVELEVWVQKNVYTERLISKGFYGIIPTQVDGELKNIKYRLQRVAPNDEASLEIDPNAPGRYGDTLYGFWGINSGAPYCEDPVILDSAGRPSSLNDRKIVSINAAIESGAVGTTIKYLTVSKSWSPLKFPKKEMR